jgi:glucosylceramidase
MKKMQWTRREALKRTALLAAGAGVGSHLRRAFGQAGPTAAAIQFVTSTATNPWQKARPEAAGFRWDTLDLTIDPAKVVGTKSMAGFGACFSDLGWTSLSALSEQDRERVLFELFHPDAGARFNYCRMPLGANDFSTGPYSYDETAGDFALKDFTVEHDRKTLIPFIHAAQRYQPALRLWASPWTPPSWMKRNDFYAEAKPYPGMSMTENGIRPDQIGHEGEEMFLLEPRYLEAYARYFGRFVDSYRAEGIRIDMVMPQNEFNSAQSFPSCTWTPEGLSRFIRALGPEMEKRGVAVYFGTDERGDPKLVQAALQNPQTALIVKGIGLQWAGKNALPELARLYPGLILFQSEQECGDGSNSWAYAGYTWQLMKTYLRHDVSGYMYWNISLDQTARSTWGWRQNSLLTVDTNARTFHYNPDFFFLKHLTHCVDVGARRLETSGTCDDVLAFVNPDGSVITLLRNPGPHPQPVAVHVAGSTPATLLLPPDSIATYTHRIV